MISNLKLNAAIVIDTQKNYFACLNGNDGTAMAFDLALQIGYLVPVGGWKACDHALLDFTASKYI